MAKKRDKIKTAGARRVADLAPKAKRATKVTGGGVEPTPFRAKLRAYGNVLQQGT